MNIYAGNVKWNKMVVINKIPEVEVEFVANGSSVTEESCCPWALLLVSTSALSDVDIM